MSVINNNNSWRKDIVSINEALQHLTKLKDKSSKSVMKFKVQSHNTGLISKSLSALALDPDRKKRKDKDGNDLTDFVSESKRAQELARDIEKSIEGYSEWKR